MREQLPIETDRLTLRAFESSDAARVQELAAAREVADTTLHIPHPYPDGAAAEWIATHRPLREAGIGVTYAITERTSGALVGAIGLSIAPEHSRAEMGYWVAVSRWNRGYATEAAHALLHVAFEVLQLHRVEARHFTRNPASGRVMQKLGMRLEGIHREVIRKGDRFEDLAVYAVLASEWASGPRRPTV